MAVTHTDRVGAPLEQSYVLLRDAERVELDIGALGLDKRTQHRGEANFRFQLLPRPDGLIYCDSLGDIWTERGLQLLLTTQRVQVGCGDGGCPIFAIKVTGRLCLHPDEFRGFSSGVAYCIEEDIHEGQIPWLVNNVAEFREREKSLSDLLTHGCNKYRGWGTQPHHGDAVLLTPARVLLSRAGHQLGGVNATRRQTLALIALNDALEDWANNLISALEH